MAFFILLFLIIAYLIGSIPTAVWVGQVFYGVDVRKEGSGNAGATNVIRVLGWKAGIPVIIVDVVKGWFAVYITVFLPLTVINPDIQILFRTGMGIAAVLGHIFPLYAGFRGGKGVATLFGMGIALYPFAIWIVAGIFIIVILIFRIVSVASVTASISFPIIMFLIFPSENIYLKLISLLVPVFVILSHISNLKRLFSGNEKIFSFGKQKESGICEKNVEKE